MYFLLLQNTEVIKIGNKMLCRSFFFLLLSFERLNLIVINRPNRGYLSLQTLGGSVCLQEKRKKLRVLFTAGLMSTFHKELDFRVINQTRLVKKVEVRPLRAKFFVFKLDQRKLERFT